jgi:hypothetical protein
MWGEEETDKLRGYSTQNKPAGLERREQPLPDKILAYLLSLMWVGLAAGCLYYSNFFYQLFHNPKILEPFFTVSMACYSVVIILTVFISFVLPLVYKIENVEEYNPRLIPIATVFGVVAVISLLVAIWPVWGYSSLLIFVLLFKGFFEVSVFLPGGNLGSVLFIMANALAVFSYKIIDHEGYLH